MNLGKALDQEIGQLHYKRGGLQHLLHESHQRDSMATGETETVRKLKAQRISYRLHRRWTREPEVELLREEVKQVGIQLLP